MIIRVNWFTNVIERTSFLSIIYMCHDFVVDAQSTSHGKQAEKNKKGKSDKVRPKKPRFFPRGLEMWDGPSIVHAPLPASRTRRAHDEAGKHVNI